MASSKLPTLPQADVASHKTAKSCYVTLGPKVYDITSFVEDHPGGGDLVLEHGGQDVTKIMGDEISHTHSESAYEMLEDYLIGFVATDEIMEAVVESSRPDDIVPLLPSDQGMKELSAHTTSNEIVEQVVYANTGLSSADDLSKETDTTADYKKHKFLDLNRPLLMQVFNGGFSKDFYLEQVHRPRHYKGGDSAPLFGNFLEPLSKTPWWVVPTVWLPPVMYGTWLASQGLHNNIGLAAYWVVGLGIWTLVEYGLHRCLFHIDK